MVINRFKTLAVKIEYLKAVLERYYNSDKAQNQNPRKGLQRRKEKLWTHTSLFKRINISFEKALAHYGSSLF